MTRRLLTRLYPRSLGATGAELAGFWRESVTDAWRTRGLIGLLAAMRLLVVDLISAWFARSRPVSPPEPERTGDSWMLTWWHDLKYSFTSLMRRPALTATSVLSLAIGLGGALAIFAAANAVLFRPLPFSAPDGLVSVEAMVQRDTLEARAFSVPDFLDYRDGVSSVIPLLSAWNPTTTTLRSGGPGLRVSGEMVSSNYFELLGVSPILGGTLPSRERTDDAPALMIGEGIWERQFARDPDVIGRTVLVDEEPFVIVGVLPASFGGISDVAETWMPFAPPLIPENRWDNRGSRWALALGRLADGVSVETADAAMKSIATRLSLDYPGTNANYTARVRPLRDTLYGDVRGQLILLLAGVGVVLFMTCVNVANLLVARLSARQYEFAVRASLGATRRRLVSLAAADGLVLALSGALVGTPLTSWLVRVLRRLNPAALPAFAEPSVTGPVVAAGVVLTLAAAVFIALASVLSLRQRPAGLTSSARSSSDTMRTVYLRRALTTLQVACATALLTTATLLSLSFRQLNQIEPGFRSDHLLMARVDLPAARYEPERRLVVKAELLDALRALPGIRKAALASDTMLSSNSSAAFYSVDIEAANDADREGRVYLHDVTRDFFDVSGIPLLEGATLPEFTGQPIDGTQPDVPVVVSKQLARRFWPGTTAVGQRLKLARSASDRPWMRIVGVVGDTKFRALPDNPTQDPDVYRPLGLSSSTDVAMIIESDVDPLSLTSAVQHAVHSVDPLLSPYGSYAIDEQVAAATSSERFLSQLSSAFGLVALMLAIVGTYGVVAYQVLLSQRATGIRLALGARPGQIFSNVMGGTARLVSVGLVAGAGLAAYAARAINELLFRPPASNALVIAAVAATVSIVALAAAWLPARRAMNVNPVSVLRAD